MIGRLDLALFLTWLTWLTGLTWLTAFASFAGLAIVAVGVGVGVGVGLSSPAAASKAVAPPEGAAAGEGDGSKAEIVDLQPVVRDGAIFVGFRVEDAFDEDIEHAISTGLDVTFRYNVELKRMRALWLDPRVAKSEIQTTVAYDNITKRYKLTREVDGKVDATEVVADSDAMRRFMTTVESMRLFDLARLEPNETYYVRARAVLSERNLLLLIPWDVATDWKEATFNYVR